MNNEMHPRLERLIDSLLERTRSGAIAWRADDWPLSFVFSGSSGAVLLESLDRDGAWPYSIRVIDPQGVEVESYVDDGQGRSLLGLLYFTVREATRDSNEVLDSLLAELEAAS